MNLASEQVQHIVFDVGNVLLHWDREIPFKRLIPDSDQREWFLNNVCTPDWNLEQDRGRTWEEGEQILIDQFPEWSDQIRGYREFWPEMIPRAIEGTSDIFKDLVNRKHDVTLLTNFAADTFKIAREMYPDLQLARGATVSGEIRLLKPEQEIYDHHCATFDLAPSKSLFIDDSFKNVTGARQSGWKACHFEDADTLIEDLTEFGINITK